MIREVVQYLYDKGFRAGAEQLVRFPDDPQHVMRFRDGAGTLQTLEAQPHPRRVILERLDDVIALVKKHFDDRVTHARMAVFHDDRGVQVVFDTVHGREIAELVLTASAEDLAFRGFIAERKVPCMTLRNLLRYELRECHNDPRLEEQIAAINTAGSNAAGGTARRGSESLSSSVLSEAKVEGGLPNELQTFRVRRWANAELDVRFPVTVVLDPDAGTRSWIVHVIECSWRVYLAESKLTVGDTLRRGLEGTGVPIYEGHFELVPQVGIRAISDSDADDDNP